MIHMLDIFSKGQQGIYFLFLYTLGTGDRITKLLRLLQIGMEVGLKKDSHCWLVYNATIHTYTISRDLMTHAHTQLVLRPLIWACVCMESSVPLLTLKYFKWRSVGCLGMLRCTIQES